MNKAFFPLFLILLFSTLAFAMDYYQLDPGSPLDITEHGTCKQLTNNAAQSLFIPTKTQAEWDSFWNNFPGVTSLAECCTQGWTAEGTQYDSSDGLPGSYLWMTSVLCPATYYSPVEVYWEGNKVCTDADIAATTCYESPTVRYTRGTHKFYLPWNFDQLFCAPGGGMEPKGETNSYEVTKEVYTDCGLPRCSGTPTKGNFTFLSAICGNIGNSPCSSVVTVDAQGFCSPVESDACFVNAGWCGMPGGTPAYFLYHCKSLTVPCSSFADQLYCESAGCTWS